MSANKTNIPWTDASWNPVTGCTKVSPGCAHCYAERFAERWRGIERHPYEQGFDLKLHPKRLTQPGRWTKPSMIFVCSMADLFQSRVPNDYLARVFRVMLANYQHTFQVLTKRTARMRAYINALGGVPPHIWVGTTAEDQQRADERVPELRRTKAAVRFISAEPLLEPIRFDLRGIDQVIVGGESGPSFRPMDPAWALDIKDQCRVAKVPFFFKQHAAVRPKELGHQLNGVEYKEYPEGQ